MANKKNHYYVLVFTSYGAVYVTGTGEHHTAFWNKLEKPKEFGKAYAEDIVLGLNLNGFNSALVVNPHEINWQPYNYEHGQFEWKVNEN